jgi:AbrB family looped-hinge helix DNA binding protein
MNTTSVTSKGQVTIPKRVRQLLGIGPGSKLAFDVEGATARIRLVRSGARSRIEDGPGILKYSGPRIAVGEMSGGAAMKKAAARARR